METLTDSAKKEFRRRLARAFAGARKKKISAKANFWCCGSCATSALGEIVNSEKMRGGVYWHNQDDEDIENGSIYIGFIGHGKNGAGALGVARDLVSELESQGLEVEWDGTTDHRILAKMPLGPDDSRPSDRSC